MLGPVQKEWLLRGLKSSSATFKVVASPVPWAEGTKPGSLDTWDGYPVEREEIFAFIEGHRIEGVLLLSADRHRSDAWRIERPEGYDLFDFSSSKLTNVHTHPVLPGALFGYNDTCSVGLLEFDTTLADPIVTYRIVSIENEEIHRLTLRRSQLELDRE
jgi:alkaline phosphatase D